MVEDARSEGVAVYHKLPIDSPQETELCSESADEPDRQVTSQSPSKSGLVGIAKVGIAKAGRARFAGVQSGVATWVRAVLFAVRERSADPLELGAQRPISPHAFYNPFMPEPPTATSLRARQSD